MKNKKILIIGIIIVIVLIIAGLITNYIDDARVRTNKEPKFCIKTTSYQKDKITYWGLGYKVIRYVGTSPNEPYENNIGCKMGNWFMKYELNQVESIEIEYKEQKVIITNIKDIGTIENILINSKYSNELCNGINTHKITLNNEIYYIKEDCKEIQKGNKQAKITDEDLNIINNIIDRKINTNIDNESNVEYYLHKSNLELPSKDKYLDAQHKALNGVEKENIKEEIRKSSPKARTFAYANCNFIKG